ncbi:hypothetical protein D047_3452B, partial [Vibrio parahaemolyticus VPTS-2010_2]
PVVRRCAGWVIPTVYAFMSTSV